MTDQVQNIKKKLENVKNKFRLSMNKTKKLTLSSMLLLGGLFGGGHTALADKVNSGEKSSLSDLYASVSHIYKKNLPKFETICDEISKISYEEAALDRTSYVFHAVVDTMNTKAAQAQAVWKNPKKKSALVKDIMYSAGGNHTFAPSCIATCTSSVFKAFDALSDTTEIISKECSTYGNTFLNDPKIKAYTVSVRPGNQALQKAITENNIQPGDFILIPRNAHSYHTVMYVGKDSEGRYLYSANNNPAVKKDIDYYNKQAIRWRRSSKIVKCNEMYKDTFLDRMKKMEQEGLAKEDILFYVYNTMGKGEAIFNNALSKLNTLRLLDNVEPFKVVPDGLELAPGPRHDIPSGVKDHNEEDPRRKQIPVQVAHRRSSERNY